MESLNRIALDSNFQSINRIVENFDNLSSENRIPLAQYWGQIAGNRSPILLGALIKAELRQRFRRGERPTATEYFNLFPHLQDDGDRALSLVYEEFCLLEEIGANPSVSEFCRRYEPWRESLVSQLGYHRELSQVVNIDLPKVSFPAVGDRFATYQLSSLLGKGGAAQVYLATDDLGGRQVVLKVSPSIGIEPSILARLEHRNIVPILTVAESPATGLRGICMPYRPGITIESLLERYRQTEFPRKAKSLYESLRIKDSHGEVDDLGWKDFPHDGTYTEAVAWIGLAMARALTYLHKRDVYHRDIKPANILLAYKEGPLLFDFNLAHDPNAPERAQAALSGGTLPYMAPEQLKAFLDPQSWQSVGPLADIYALGLVLRELVLGVKPEVPRKELPLSRAIQDLHDRRQELLQSTRLIRPEIPPSLDAIILKCLALNPADRFLSAADLARDLQRFLNRQPLATAQNPSRLEIAVNWGYRRRRVIGIAVLLCFCGLLAVRRSQPAFSEAMLRQGVEMLASPSVSEWGKARDYFERLANAYPDHAGPLIFLGLSLHRLSQPDLGDAHLEAAYRKKDAEVAIQAALKSQNQSVPLKLSLARHLFSVKGNVQASRALTLEVIDLDPEHIGAWMLLGSIDQKKQRYADAVTAYTRAFHLALKIGDFRQSEKIRIALVPMLLRDLDFNLFEVKTAASYQRAKQLLVTIRSQIKELNLKKSTEDAQNSAVSDCNLAYIKGSFYLGLAYLEGLDQNKKKSSLGFGNAKECFQLTLRLAKNLEVAAPPEVSRFCIGIQNSTAKQLVKLERLVKDSHFDLSEAIAGPSSLDELPELSW